MACNDRFVAVLLLGLLMTAAAHGATIETEVTLRLGSAGMQSFATYHYYYGTGDLTPQRYERVKAVRATYRSTT